nr:Chain B, NBR1-LIR peptide [Homo sapiens]
GAMGSASSEDYIIILPES